MGAVVEEELDGADGEVPFLAAGTKIVFELVIVGGYLGKVKVTEDNLEDDVVLCETFLEMNGGRVVENFDLDTVDVLLNPGEFALDENDVTEGDEEVLPVVVIAGCVITEYPGVVVEEVGCIGP